jgi:hypothetical protein
MAIGFAIGVVAGAVLFLIVRETIVVLAIRDRRTTPLSPLWVDGLGDRRATLDELVEAARAAALRVRTMHDGFDVLSQPSSRIDRVVSVRVRDRAPASAATIGFTYDGSYPLALHVLVALAPVLGPMALMLDGDRIVIDGTKDVHDVTNEHARFVRARIRERLGGAASGPPR